MFQSTHPHGVRPFLPLFPTEMACVSIHAPARGATSSSHVGLYLGSAFQSTHPHGVRHKDEPFPIAQNGFNPRTRTGCDFAPCRANKNRNVSIHAPARGATKLPVRRRASFQCFNPRTRTGCDSKCNTSGHCCRSFNPRTRTGCDQELAQSEFDLLSFNPRTRTGCDLRNRRLRKQRLCFNPRTRTGCDAFTN